MRNSSGKKILLIEDEAHIAEGLRLNLTLHGHEVEIAGDGPEGLRMWKEWNPDLIVLDIMLPVIDGFSVLRNIRLEDERLPVLILSAKSQQEDKIKGLDFGGDDYLAKPFNLEEFLLRVDRLLIRSTWSREKSSRLEGNDSGLDQSMFVFGDNRVDFEQSVAHCRKGMIRLTEQERKLLKMFIKHEGKPLSRKQLLEIGWGYSGNTTTRTVDNFIVRFRKYFEKNPKKPEHFKSLRSVGYIFEKNPEKEEIQE